MKNFHDEVMSRFFKNIPGIKSRAMFGGHGLYKNGVIFGIIAEGNLYFKVDASNIEEYQAAKSTPFTYVGASGKPVSMSYWKVPASILKNEKTLSQWIDRSWKISLKKSTKRLSRTKS
jgi:DNA transformation protein